MPPADSVIAPEPEAKVIVLKPCSAPVVPIEPAPSPVAPLPKFTSSAVVVLVTAGTEVPAGSVLQNVLLPQVPLAVPKPAVAPLASQ